MNSESALVPKFAIVGHPNKGKSTIVATLVQNDQIVIEAESGTTMSTGSYDILVDGRRLLEFFDTPGFQRARRCLQWLKQKEVPTELRPQRIRQFIQADFDEHGCADEVALLEPIMAGAGIVYVVDGSLPYTNEYEAEMEVLRWTGQPRVALINPISGDEYVQDWQNALNQYFSSVRVFNPLRDGFSEQMDILSGFALLNSEWTSLIQGAVNALKKQQRERVSLSAELITSMLIDALSLQHSYKKDHPGELWQQQKTEVFYQALRKIEQKCRGNIEQVFSQRHLKKTEAKLAFEQEDLFVTENWYLWGLKQKQLLAVSSGAGAAIGAVADVAVGGASLLLGALSGSVVGGAAGWWFSRELPSIKVKGMLPLGGQQWVIGPIRHPNFPFVLLSRAIEHLQLIASRSHGQRDVLQVTGTNEVIQAWSTKEQASWLKLLKEAADGGQESEARAKLQAKLTQWLLTLCHLEAEK